MTESTVCEVAKDIGERLHRPQAALELRAEDHMNKKKSGKSLSTDSKQLREVSRAPKREPRLALQPAGQPDPNVTKQVIDEWLVPRLVDEFLREQKEENSSGR